MLLPFYLCSAAIFAALAIYLLLRFLIGIFDCLSDKKMHLPVNDEGGCPCCTLSTAPAAATAGPRGHFADLVDYTPISGSFR